MPDNEFTPRRTRYRHDEALAVLTTFDGTPVVRTLRAFHRPPAPLVAGMLCHLFPADQDEPREHFHVTCHTPDALRDVWREYLRPPYHGAGTRPELGLAEWAAVRAAAPGTVRWQRAELSGFPDFAPDEEKAFVLSMVVGSDRLTYEMVRAAVGTALSELGGAYAGYTAAWDETPSPAYAAARERFEFWEEMAVRAVDKAGARRRLAFADQVWVNEVLPLTAGLAATRVCTSSPELTARYEAGAAAHDVSFAARMRLIEKRLEDDEEGAEVVNDRDAYAHLCDEHWATGGVDALRAELETLRPYAALDPTLSIQPMLDWLAMMEG